MSNTPSLPVIQAQNLTYSYKNLRALNDATFTVAARSIHGFVGPNGAGKTTALKILSTLVKPQGGKVQVFGHDISRDYQTIRKRIGFMPDHFAMYRQMTVFEYLDFFAAAYGMGLRERDRIIKDVLALTDMESRKDDLIRALSTGMKQRVGLARVLVHDPELLLLDEPASGLDPRARIELMEILRELRGMGKTIFISSHILSELGMLCDHVTILDRGVVKYSGLMKGLLTRNGDTASYLVTLAEEAPLAIDALRRVAGVSGLALNEGETLQWRVTFDGQSADTSLILQTLITNGGRVVAFQEDLKHLNQAFMDLTEPGVPPPLPK